MKKRLLWIGDAVASTGFARMTHKILDVLKDEWDVCVLGMNYVGDPHKYPYPIFPAQAGGDYFGLNRTAPLVSSLRPDIVVVLNDPWNINGYLQRTGNVPVVASMPVDGKNCKGRALHGLAMGVFWTEFGQMEARLGGYIGPSCVIPLGVDTDLYMDLSKDLIKNAAQTNTANSRIPDNAKFIIGNVNRNQPRKRIDLTISFFAEWIKTRGIDDTYLFLHVAPTGESAYDISQLTDYYKIATRVIMREPEIGFGIDEGSLACQYNLFDVQISTTQGEGWGLCAMEGMSCGVPQIVPDWSALGEWPGDAVYKVPCSEIAMTINNINAVGGIPDRKKFLEALDFFYENEDARADYAERGKTLVNEDRFRWENIGKQYNEVLNSVLRCF